MKARTNTRQGRRRFLQIAGVAAAALMLEGLPFASRAANAGKMKIGIVGSGRVGGGIGSVWVRAGHEVMFSSRHIEHDKALAAELGARAHAGTPREAAAFGQVDDIGSLRRTARGRQAAGDADRGQDSDRHLQPVRLA
jgi:hypothetical protein